MMKYQVRSPEDALVYMIDCTLATIQSMAMRKSKSRSEYKRQISIAQTGIDWARGMKIGFNGTRIAGVVNECGGNVAEWAQLYEPIDD